MNRITTVLLAALEGLIVAAIGLGVALVPLTILWAAQFNLAIDWFVFWRAAVDVWLLGNGADLTVHLGDPVVGTLGLPAAGAPFPITIALLGFAALAAALGVRTGRRAAESHHRPVGVTASIATYAVVAALLTLSADGGGVVQPAPLQGIVLPTLVFGAGVVFGAWALRPRTATGEPAPRDDQPAGRIRSRFEALDENTRHAIQAALRGGAAVCAAVIAVSALAVTVLVLAQYGTVIGLYETVQAGVAGGIALTVAQLAFLPNLVVWAAAWFVGPGFALGEGSSVSPLGTALGPVPGVPILGILPHGTLGYGFLGLLVPVLAGFVCAWLAGQRMPRSSPEPGLGLQLATGFGIGLVAAVLLGLLAWWSGGALGPGRLSVVGPNPFLVAGLAFVEVGIAASLGAIAARRRDRR
ncbi:cell division protein PerM [Cryobacterium tepidiphilum]|uniref:Uncharacterized protein n=1 Tax=Cryobacterium tepidiphilum TaxID=2486026 RepID=A0A3M8LHA5_9MICO|nr:DUF6350 family protein [Cryobacterium tepidiphilum]RNE64004.1 hypothetical protein EEJ31_05410 [Cryobacterium tepidiphilum]